MDIDGKIIEGSLELDEQHHKFWKFEYKAEDEVVAVPKIIADGELIKELAQIELRKDDEFRYELTAHISISH
jgi:hypothetical protein